MALSPAWRGTLRFGALLAVVCAGVFLVAAGFLASWDGSAVSLRAWPGDEEPDHYRVLIVEPDGRSLERDWPADVVRGLGLPVQSRAIPPARVPKGRPHTWKERFRLHFFVQQPDGEHLVVPTPSPASLAIALFAYVALFALRNMYVSGSPVSITPRRMVLPAPLAPVGQPASKPGPKAARSRKGPPPRGGSKKRRRRR